MGEDVDGELAAGNNAAAAGRALRGLVTLPVGMASDIGSLAGRALAPGWSAKHFATGESPTGQTCWYGKAAQTMQQTPVQQVPIGNESERKPFK